MAFLKLAFEKRKLNEGEGPQGFFEYIQGEHSALLESGKGGRYSYVAFDPFLVVWSRDGVTHYKKDGMRQILDGGPLEELRNLLRKFEYKGSSPVPFYGVRQDISVMILELVLLMLSRRFLMICSCLIIIFVFITR